MKISEFLSISDGGAYFDSTVNQELFSQLVNDFGIPPETVEFLGAIKKEYNMYSETSILYKFSQETKKIGDCLKILGTLIKRIPLKPGDDFGIQELDPTRSDGYYVLFYLLEKNTEK